MSGTIVRIDDLDEAIAKEIDQMNRQVIENCNKAAEKAASAGAKQLRQTSPVRHDNYHRKWPPGSYAKSWTRKKEENQLGVATYTIYNSKFYQLTHLLEFGHIIAATGERWEPSSKHITPVNQSATQQYLSEVEKMKL